MPHTKQAKKRMRQNRTRYIQNKSKISVAKTAVKRAREAAEEGDKEKAQEALKLAYRYLDKAARAHILHPNKAGRQKAQLAKKVNALEEREKSIE